MAVENERNPRSKALEDALRDAGSEINIDALLVSEAEQIPKQIVNNDDILLYRRRQRLEIESGGSSENRK